MKGERGELQIFLMNDFSLEFDSFVFFFLSTSVDFAVDSFADFDVEFSFFVEFVVGSEGKLNK